jgi:hypothetical protein
MTKLDETMDDVEIKRAVWDHFGFDHSIPYPKIPETLLYGILSREVRGPEVRSIFVSDKASIDYQSFFSLLAKEFSLTFETFSEEAAASIGDDMNGGRLPLSR